MPKDDFVEFKVLRDDAGVVIAVITFRTRANGERLFSFSLMREFDSEGISKRTCWLNDRHADAALRLIPRAKAEIQKEEAAYKARSF